MVLTQTTQQGTSGKHFSGDPSLHLCIKWRCWSQYLFNIWLNQVHITWSQACKACPAKNRTSTSGSSWSSTKQGRIVCSTTCEHKNVTLPSIDLKTKYLTTHTLQLQTPCNFQMQKSLWTANSWKRSSICSTNNTITIYSIARVYAMNLLEIFQWNICFYF
jgi:hypothetical protein